MSDSDDGFDREAEREKLREKYERDKEKREATERMSDLLLKGATMTNQHCGTCGSPIFRHEGQAFCPTCQEPVGEGAEQPAQAGEQQAQQAGGEQPAAESGPAGQAGPDESTRDAQTVDGDPDSRTGTDGPDRQTGSAETPAAGSSTGRAGAGDATPRNRPSAGREQVSGTGAGDGDLGSVQASLTRTLAELTRQAEATDDLGRKRDYLAAAKEAAETLRAVRQARR